MPRMPRPALLPYQSIHWSRARFRKQNTRLERRQSWQLYPVSLIMHKSSSEQDVLAFALRNVAAEHSDKPIYFVFPARRSSSRAPIDSSNGVSWDESAIRVPWKAGNPQLQWIILTGINSVKVVEIRGETKSVDRPLDVFFNVFGRVRHFSLGPKNLKSTL